MIEPLYLYIVAGLVLVFILIITLFRRRPQRKANVQSQYITALIDLVEGHDEQALAELRNVVRHDTENIQAYIQIGRILRKKGASEDAAKIHRDLLVRPHLKDDVRLKILVNLAKDYHEMGQAEKALNTCEQILSMQRNNKWATEFKLKQLELTQDWQNAFDLAQKNFKGDKIKKALYKVEQGRQFVDLGQEHDARLCYHEALKQNPDCAPALIETVKSYIRDNRPKDALKSLEKFIKSGPQSAQFALGQLKSELYELDAFGQLEKYYKQILKDNPNASQALLDLCDFYIEKGELRRALEYINHLLQHTLENKPAQFRKIAILEKLYDYEKAAKFAVQSFHDCVKKSTFICHSCGHAQQDYFWHCPTCKTWDSAQRG